MGSVSVLARRLRQRKNMGDRMLVINDGKVYDITDFAPNHPGGMDIIKDHVGQDITKTMHRVDPHRHSDGAYAILEKYYVHDVNSDSDNNVKQQENKKSKVSNGIVHDDITDPYKHDQVDWDKPLFFQIPSLGDKYFDWVHTPVDRPLRLFQSQFIEMFSRCPWWLVPLVWFPVIGILLQHAGEHLEQQTEVAFKVAFGGFHVGVTHMPMLFVFGIISWTFLEYSIHRWIFHLKPPPNNTFLILFHFVMHGQHHKSPMDPMRLVFPPFPATIFAVLMFYMFRVFWPYYSAMTVMAGNVTGYVFYDLIHYYVHHGGMPVTAYFRSLKTYHMAHHFTEQQLGFGISSKLWDYPFKTLIKISD